MGKRSIFHNFSKSQNTTLIPHVVLLSWQGQQLIKPQETGKSPLNPKVSIHGVQLLSIQVLSPSHLHWCQMMHSFQCNYIGKCVCSWCQPAAVSTNSLEHYLFSISQNPDGSSCVCVEGKWGNQISPEAMVIIPVCHLRHQNQLCNWFCPVLCSSPFHTRSIPALKQYLQNRKIQSCMCHQAAYVRFCIPNSPCASQPGNHTTFNCRCH